MKKDIYRKYYVKAICAFSIRYGRNTATHSR